MWKHISKIKYFLHLLLGIVFLLVVRSVNSFYLPLLENREGFDVYDPLLRILPSIDLSGIIFIATYGGIALGFFLLSFQPKLLLQSIFAYGVMYLLRFICIFLIPLNVPENQIVLYDPLIESMFYSEPLTKDLFYSGHFASIFLLFILLKKYFFLFLSFFVGFLLLVQHIHYSYDLVGAVFFSYLSVTIARVYLSYTWELTHNESYQKSIG